MASRLYLLGGSPAYPAYVGEFVAACGGQQACLAVLVQTAAGWEKHRSLITGPWTSRGITRIEPVFPGEGGRLDLERAVAILQRATGIFIGGGHTPTYHRLFATGPVGAAIRERYRAGVPVAGVSAGALISMELCQLTPDETGEPGLHVAAGLGLAQGFVIGVHFTERSALPEVVAVMAQTHTRLALGIDEGAGVVCEDGKFARVLGEAVHVIEMMDFDRCSFAHRSIARGSNAAGSNAAGSNAAGSNAAGSNALA